MKKYLLTLMLGACTSCAFATTYYMNPAEGNDANPGTSPCLPWATAQALSHKSLAPGDSVLFKSGTTLNQAVWLRGAGTPEVPIIIDTYGGSVPAAICTDGEWALKIKNSDYLTVQNLDISCHGATDLPKRAGVVVECTDYGISHGISLLGLTIHDVNGSLVKEQGGGSGILVHNGGRRTPSAFDGLLIDGCVVRDCQRNGMIWSAPWNRDSHDWLPSTGVVVRNCLIEGVPGDGIVPIGCDGALIEYNLMRLCPATLPTSEAAAGIWPWSCDDTVIQFNEVSGHKAPWDGQAYDSDYNCTGTTIQYNYSHDCDGGMVLLCNSGTSPGAGNQATVVRYNISVNDGMRPRTTRQGVFAPTIHIAGPVKGALVEHNILHIGPKPAPYSHRSAITSDSWDGYADSTTIRQNVFYAAEPSSISLGESTANTIANNWFIGSFVGLEEWPDNSAVLEAYDNIIGDGSSPHQALMPLLQTRTIADGATLITVDPAAIRAFFE